MESDEEPEVESLLKEVRSGTPNIDLILNLCASNCPECDYESEDGSTILHIAVRNVKLLQHLHVVQALIAACTSFVAKPNRHGFLPIHKAVSVAFDDHVPAVDALIEANPDTLTAQTLDGQTVLHLAITGPRNPSKGIVELLSQRQPLLGYTADAYGQLPLHKLVSRPRVEAELVQYLIQCNPHATSLKDSKGFTPLHWIVCRSSPNIDVLLAVLEDYKEALLEVDYEGRTPLMRYIQNPDKDPDFEGLLAEMTDMAREDKLAKTKAIKRDESIDSRVHRPKFSRQSTSSSNRKSPQRKFGGRL